MALSRLARLALSLAITVALCAEAVAGPPLICQPFDGGTSALLPWGSGRGWNAPDRRYDTTRLATDVLRLLDEETPVLVRMETLRRATIYAARDPRAAHELLVGLLARALSRAASGAPDRLAVFDAGYLIESYRQGTFVRRWDMLSGRDRASWTLLQEPKTLDGYALVRRALELGEPSPEMEFAASLMTTGAAAEAHRARAAAGARAGSSLARNLER